MLTVLLIDDDATQRKIAKDAIEIYLKKNHYPVTIHEAGTKEAGLLKLNEQDFDGAIVDLRLKQNDSEGEGNSLLRVIKQKLRFPIRVVSGHLADLEDEFKEKTYFSDYYNRDNVDYEKIISDFIDIHRTGITRILNNKGRINTDISKIFWRHISAILPEFIAQQKKDADWDVEKILLRYISLHISEYLELSIENNLEPAHPIEFYIKPPIKSKIFTGDILLNKKDDTLWIILTPACDLATDAKRASPKAAFVTMAAIQSIDEVQAGKNAGEVRKLNGNTLDLKYHFLPKSFLFPGGYVNFQIVQSVQIEEVVRGFEVSLVVAGHFKKDIISRFGNYYSRQGQPALFD